MSSVLTTKDLSKATGYTQNGKIEQCLRNQGIAVFDGKDGPWTLQSIVEAAGGLGITKKPDDKLSASDILG